MKPLTRAELAQAADQLRAVLGRIEAGELTAKPAMMHRLEGAVVALAAVADPDTDPAAALRDAFRFDC